MSKSKNSIVEVFEENFVEEIKRMSSYADKYKFVAMDTEFPGIVYQLKEYSQDFYYKTIKMNVDNLKVIQVGVTLCDEKGKSPEPSTWQFNLKFDWTKEKYSNESIALLGNSGIDFGILSEKGIPFELFAEYLVTSGLILNEEIHWISFHGSYDFAYLLRLISGHGNLPENENSFLEHLELYFQNFYDIRVLLKNQDSFKGSLNKIANDLEVIRVGTTHQAGSDSIVTAEVFFRLFKRAHLNGDHLKSSRNVLFGLGDGADDYETLSYMNFSTQNFTNSSPPLTTNQNQIPPNMNKNINMNYANYGYSYLNAYTKPANPNVLYPNMNMYNNSGYSLPVFNYNSMTNMNVSNLNINANNVNNVNFNSTSANVGMLNLPTNPNALKTPSLNLNLNMAMGNFNSITGNGNGNSNGGLRNDKKKPFGKILEAKSN
jgi:CCR4-NOT transcription complex subunit 7/8